MSDSLTYPIEYAVEEEGSNFKFFFLEKNVAENTDFEQNDDDELICRTYEMLCNTCSGCERDRKFILEVEKMIDSFDNSTSVGDVISLPSMSSYQRMLVHKVSDLYYICHATDSSKNRVVLKIVQKSRRMKKEPFRVFVANSSSPVAIGNPVTKKILRRSVTNKDKSSPQAEAKQASTKPIQERELEYKKERERIFGVNCQSTSTDDLVSLEMELNKKLLISEPPGNFDQQLASFTYLDNRSDESYQMINYGYPVNYQYPPPPPPLSTYYTFPRENPYYFCAPQSSYDSRDRNLQNYAYANSFINVTHPSYFQPDVQESSDFVDTEPVSSDPKHKNNKETKNKK